MKLSDEELSKLKKDFKSWNGGPPETPQQIEVYLQHYGGEQSEEKDKALTAWFLSL